jgi:hypothetical protein
VPPPLTWQILSDYYGLSFSNCFFGGHWLLSDALPFVISMSCKLKEENQVLFSFESLMEKNLVIVDELALLDFNIRKEVCDVLHSCFHF